jgi:hypothetical protein
VEVEKWLDKQRERLLACDHYHVVFTVPSELNDLWAYNQKRFANLLFTSVRDSLLKLLADEKYLGARPGIIMALHTWGQTLITHPHIHCLITGGGLSADGRWRTVRKTCLLPRKVLMIIFRGKLRDALGKALSKGQLRLPPGTRPIQVRNLLNRLGRETWNVKILERYEHGEGVLKYLARYLRGGPISNRRIVACRDGQVTFRYLDRRDLDEKGRSRTKEMALPVATFLHRLLQHVPLPGMQTVRSYGIYANNKTDDLSRCRELLGQPPLVRRPRLSAREALERVLEAKRIHREEQVCPKCGEQVCRVRTLVPGRHPPWRKVA